MNNQLVRFLLVLSLAFIGCEDNAVGPSALPVDALIEPDMERDAFLVDATEERDVFLGEAAYVELKISPRKALYALTETPTVTATVYDRLGVELEGYPVRYDSRPIDSASVTQGGVVSFLREGAGAIRGCATPDLCGRVSFFVDDAPPILEIIEPARGAYLSGEPVIRVEGRTDSGGGVQVYLNDEELEVDDEGNFSTQIDAKFGLNLIDVIADDGVRRPATRSVREVVWSPLIQPRVPAGSVFESAASIRVNQGALDAPRAVDLPDANPILLESAAALIEALFVRIDGMSLVDSPQLLDEEIASLRLIDVGMGTPEVQMLFVDNALEVFFSVEALSVELAGDATIAGELFTLDGTVNADAAAFVRVNMVEAAPGVFSFQIDDYGASIERITALMEDQTVQIVLEGAETIVGRPLRAFLTQYLDELIQEHIPGVLQVGLDSVFEPLQGIPIELEDEGPLGSARVDFSLHSVSPRVEAGDGLYFDVAVSMSEPENIMAVHETPGIPSFSAANEPPWPPNDVVAVALRLFTINSVLDSLWRQGLLSVDLSEQIPANLQFLLSGARVDARLPPLLVPSPVGAPDELIFQLGELDLILESPMRQEPDIYVVSVRAGFYVDFTDGQLTLGMSPNTTEIRFELRQSQLPQPILPTVTIDAFVQQNIWPEIEANLGEILSVDLDEVIVDEASIRDFVPSFDFIKVLPIFDTLPKAVDGWIVGGASARLELHLAP